LRHSHYWIEEDEKLEWGVSANAAEETPVDPNEPFDFNAKPERFYIELEVNGTSFYFFFCFCLLVCVLYSFM